MKLIAVMNQKGGVGKTTTSLNLGHALSLMGHKVTLLDLDPQAHLSASFGLDYSQYSGMDELMMGGMSLSAVQIKMRENLYLVPAGKRLGELETMTEGGAARGGLLRDALKNSFFDDEIVLIDCPPSAGLLGMNVLFATQSLLIPVSSDYLGLHALGRFMSILQHIEKTLKHKFHHWLLVTRFHARRRLAKEVREKLYTYFPGHVLTTEVRETVALAESPSFGKTIFEYRKKSHGAEDYYAVANELYQKMSA
ncbi:MAG: ParA family protein [Gammaproteobacteria bacterium]|nr:ParA family protein [Gammaproteobacteria bacterium]